MRIIAAKLTPGEIDGLAAYYRAGFQIDLKVPHRDYGSCCRLVGDVGVPCTPGGGIGARRALLRPVTKRPLGPKPWRAIFLQFSIMMIVLMLGNIVQVAFWAPLYRVLGAFEDFETALYFSGVTFTSLGYGDVVLTGRVRLLAPLQAANGLMMFGITTAVFIAAVQNAVAEWSATNRDRVQDAG